MSGVGQNQGMKKKLLALALVPFLSGCGLIFVHGPAPGWQDASSGDLTTMAASAPCSTGKFPIIGDVIIGGFGAGIVIATLYDQTQHDPGFSISPDGTRHSLSGWSDSDKAAAGFGAVLAAPYLLSAVLGNQKVNDCRAFNARLLQERRGNEQAQASHEWLDELSPLPDLGVTAFDPVFGLPIKRGHWQLAP